MTPGLRFHFDEHVDPAIADALRIRGIDVTTTVEAGLISASDEEQLAYAVRQGRVIMTHDQDFLTLAANGTHHAGICYCHVNARTVGELIKSLALLAFCVEPPEMFDHVEFL
jgi:predicted nuclease of predicted toxin-antitoxin system